MMQKLIYVDIFYTERWFPALLSTFTTEEEDHGINEFFEENGFQSTSLVMILGSTLVFLLLQLVLFTFYPVLHILSKFKAW
jgi:hypothetical protein